MIGEAVVLVQELRSVLDGTLVDLDEGKMRVGKKRLPGLKISRTKPAKTKGKKEGAKIGRKLMPTSKKGKTRAKGKGEGPGFPKRVKGEKAPKDEPKKPEKKIQWGQYARGEKKKVKGKTGRQLTWSDPSAGGKVPTEPSGGKKHSPFKRKRVLGKTKIDQMPSAAPPHASRKVAQTKDWSCRKIAKYVQKCVHRNKKRKPMIVRIKPSYKKGYNKSSKEWQRMGRIGNYPSQPGAGWKKG